MSIVEGAPSICEPSSPCEGLEIATPRVVDVAEATITSSETAATATGSTEKKDGVGTALFYDPLCGTVSKRARDAYILESKEAEEDLEIDTPDKIKPQTTAVESSCAAVEKVGGHLCRKRKRSDSSKVNDFPQTRTELSPELLQQRIKRQVEYYLSDESLTYDSFFQEKMRATAKEGHGESLDIQLVVTCPRMKSLNVTEEEIIRAVADSTVVKVKKSQDGATYLCRSQPLPELRERPTTRKYSAPLGVRGATGLGRDCHAAGCFLRLRNVPEEVKQWSEVKDAVKAAMPCEVFVRFVSRIDSVHGAGEDSLPTRECWLLLGLFEDDRATIEKLQPIKINMHGGTAEATLMNEREVKAARADMPPRIRLSYEKDLQILRRQLAALPLTVGGVPFSSVDHLRKCVSEFLTKTNVDEALKPGSAAENALKGLLEYHPKSILKLGGHDKQFAGIKVGFHEKTNNRGDQQKCFYIVRKNRITGEEDEEDFSASKCIAELAKDPPCTAEAVARLLKQRYEAAANQRAHAAAHAENRKKLREDAARATAVGPAHTESDSKQLAKQEDKTGRRSMPLDMCTAAESVPAIAGVNGSTANNSAANGRGVAADKEVNDVSCSEMCNSFPTASGWQV